MAPMSKAESKASTSSLAALAEDIAALGPWFHNLHLPDGTQTAPNHFLGGDFPSFKWEQIRDHLPADLSGWTALDIGCNAGFYSFELARRGATVTGIDHDPHYLRQARWAAGQLGLEGRVRFQEKQVYDLAASPERYDLVLFMGVLYHLRYPLLGLDIVARKVGRRLIFQTLTMPGEEVAATPADLPIDEREPMTAPGWPKMAFIEHRLANDPTNWWAPNHAGVEAMLRSAGLRVLERPGHEIYVCEPGEPREELAWIESELRAATGRPAVATDSGPDGS
jgi:tRNA (mo5U34)-methyltransferase